MTMHEQQVIQTAANQLGDGVQQAQQAAGAAVAGVQYVGAGMQSLEDRVGRLETHANDVMRL